MKKEEIKKAVKDGYAKIARSESTCCAPLKSCCGSTAGIVQSISKKIGYTEGELRAVPDGANLGLGCGNPVALASLRGGQTILDLGSGAGFDCFLAANKVGGEGKVIGVDMTPEMIEKARQNAQKGNYQNVEFRLGEIENLPVDNNSVDVVISNCVINLLPDKGKVFEEAFRVLKPGGRLIVSDIVLLEELPEFVKNSLSAYAGCLSGAIMKENYIEAIERAGFEEVRIMEEMPFSLECMVNDPTAKIIIEDLDITVNSVEEITGSVVSMKVMAEKPSEKRASFK